MLGLRGGFSSLYSEPYLLSNQIKLRDKQDEKDTSSDRRYCPLE